MATSWGQRKALGKRYSIDPALLYELEKLQQQYALAPGREARGMQAAQYAESMAFSREQADLNRAEREEANKQAAKSGMMGTAGNLLTTAATLRAITKKPGDPFFGKWGSGAAEQPASVSMTQKTPEQIRSEGGAYTTTPATTDMASSAAISGFSGSAGAGEAAVPSLYTNAGTLTEGAYPLSTYGGTGQATGMGASGGSAAGTGGGGSFANFGGVTAIIGAAEGVKSLAQSSRPGKYTTGYNNPAQAGAEMASHPVSAAINPGTTISDWNLVDKDTGLGKFLDLPGRVEEELMKPFSGIIPFTDEGTVICTELYSQGFMDEETYLKDAEFGKKQDIEVIAGYHTWGIPLAKAMRNSRVVTWLVKPLALAWAEDMSGKKNALGAFLNKIGIPICRFIGERVMEVAHG